MRFHARVVNVKEMNEWRETRNKRCRSVEEGIKERKAEHPNIEPTKRQPVREREREKREEERWIERKKGKMLIPALYRCMERYSKELLWISRRWFSIGSFSS